MKLAAGGAATFSNMTMEISVRAQDASAAAPVPTVTLTRPDLKYVAGSSIRIARVRPHRKGGVCLAPEGPITTPSGRKDIVHNYGHSGAGITLSWGCASVACDLVKTILDETGRAASPPPVAILGYGVIGLTVATELRRRWPSMALTFYAKEFKFSNITSFFAGGQFAPSQIFDEYCPADVHVLVDYLNRSKMRLKELLATDPTGSKYGIRSDVNNYCFSPDPDFEFSVKWGILDPLQDVKLVFTNSATGQKKTLDGVRYKTWLVNPTIMLPQLATELSGVMKVTRTFGSKADVLKNVKETIIVNCTGYGAGAIFNDDKVEPHRGHLLVQPKNPTMLRDFFSGGCENGKVAYLFERQRDIVIGGTVFKPAPGDKQNHPDKYKKLERDFFDVNDPEDHSICESLLLQNMRKIFDGDSEMCVSPHKIEAEQNIAADSGGTSCPP
jgi:D-amino-acid oxidase